MVQHILVAVDGSPSSRSAAKFALSLAEQTKAKVTLLTVLQLPDVIPMGPLGTSIVAPKTTEKDIADVRAQLDAISAEHPGVRVARSVELGPVAETIIDFASHHRADLIIMGARGLGPARRFLLGSISDRVMHHAHCPVTVWR